jgi:kinesin family protein 11
MDSHGSHHGRTAGENVQVLVRCRPLNDRELADKQTSVVKCYDGQKQLVVQPKGSKVPSKTFYFDSIFGPERTQRDLFQSSILPIIDEVLDGYSCTIFAYGTTGTGKTFTMEGPPGSFEPLSASASATDRVKSQMEAGIIARSVQEVFDRLDKSGLEYSVRVSHLELYNEDLCDLLSPSTEGLKLLEDPRLGVQVHNLAELPVYNPQDIFNILQKSYTERRTAETSYNQHSSRSHCVFSITIHIKESSTEGEDLIKVGKLNLVDLAGSENIGRSGADRDMTRKQEAGNINKSLLTLGRVITALTEGQMHIPYRESKLTRLLQDSLGGRTKTCIIATISPSSGNVEETMSTLEYAFRAKNIKNRPEVNHKMAKREVIKEYTSEINTLRAQLDCMRRKDGVYLPNEEYDRMLRESKELAEQVALIEETLKVKERAFEELQELFDRKSVQAEKTEKKLLETEGVLTKTKADLTLTTNTLFSTRVELDEQKYLVSEHEKTEETLGMEADGVLKELKIAISDTLGLFDKIGRKQNVDEENVDRIAQLRVQMMAGLTQAEDELRSFALQASDALSTVDTEIVSLAQAQTQSNQTVQQQLATLQADHQHRIEELAGKVSSEADSNRKAFERLSKSASQFATSHESSFAQHMDARSNTWRSIQLAEDEYKEDMEKWAMGQLRFADEKIEMCRTHVQKTSASLASMDQKVIYHCADQSATLVAQEERLKEFMVSQTANLHAFRASFIASVTNSLDEFIGQQLTDTKMVLEAVQSQLAKTVEEGDRFQSEHSKWTASESQAANSFMEDAHHAFGEYKRAIGARVSVHESYATDAKMALSSFEKSLNKQAQIELQDTQKLAKSVVGLTGERLEGTNNFEIDVEMRVEDLNGNLELNRQLVESTLVGRSDEMQLHVGQIAQMIAATKDSIGSYEEETVEGTKDKKDRLATFVLQQYQPTGVTPVKRNFHVPTGFAATRPHPEILADYRVKQGYEEKVQAAQDTSYLLERPTTPASEAADALMAERALQHSSSDLKLNASGGLNPTFSPLSVGQENAAPVAASKVSPVSAQPTAPRTTIQIINGRAVPGLPAAPSRMGSSSAATTIKKTTSAATLTAPSRAPAPAKAAAAAKKSAPTIQKKVSNPSVHGPPLAEVNR